MNAETPHICDFNNNFHADETLKLKVFIVGHTEWAANVATGSRHPMPAILFQSCISNNELFTSIYHKKYLKIHKKGFK